MFIKEHLGFFKSLPFQLVLAIFFGVLAQPVLPQTALNALFTAGMLFKDVLMMFIPLVVAGYLMSSLTSFDRKGLLLVLGIVFLALLSGFITVCAAYSIAYVGFPLINLVGAPIGCVVEGEACVRQLWTFPFESPLTPTVAIVCALFFGFLAVFADIQPIKNFAQTLRQTSTNILKRYFIPLLPLYVLAVMIKMQSGGALMLLLKDYGKVCGLLQLSLCAVFAFSLFLLRGGSLSCFQRDLKMFATPALTAFSTMSGVATMPILVDQLSARLKSEKYPSFIVPITTNIHTLGDGFAITFSALALATMVTGSIPGFTVFLGYALYYCLARFFNACVPGGGALIMAPFVQQCLGLPPESIGVFVTLYVLQDPLITMWNTLGNGLFALATYPLFSSFITKKNTSEALEAA